MKTSKVTIWNLLINRLTIRCILEAITNAQGPPCLTFTMRTVPFIGWSGTCALQPLCGVFDSLLACSRLFLSQYVESVLVFAQFSAQANNRPRSHNLGLWNAAVQQISTVGFELAPWCGCPETTQTKSEFIQSCDEMNLGMANKFWDRFSRHARFMFHLFEIWINDGRTTVYASPKQPHISEKCRMSIWLTLYASAREVPAFRRGLKSVHPIFRLHICFPCIHTMEPSTASYSSTITIPDTLRFWPWPRHINPHYSTCKKESSEWCESFKAFSPSAQKAFNKCDFSKWIPLHILDHAHIFFKIFSHPWLTLCSTKVRKIIHVKRLSLILSS